MKVYKFGGASTSSIERIKYLKTILLQAEGEKVLVVVSAMGKTTNALEKVADAFYLGKQEEALQLFQVIKQKHLDMLKYLVTKNWQAATEELQNYFTEIEWLLHDKPVRSYDYYYDQIVCVGELMAASLLSSYLNEEKVFNQLIDVRDIIRTDDNFRDAAIDWDYTVAKVDNIILPVFDETHLIITQGFVGSTDENESTTLGREGSDYTAAVFANMLPANSLTIWKDVEGVMNGDPKEFPDAVYIPALGYAEVIEMAYYGAQVIHPKTIKPLENKNIALYVKCFLDPQMPGTLITKDHAVSIPPIKVVKRDQVLLSLSTNDFSFAGEKAVRRMYDLFAELRIRPNLVQTTAIRILSCMDDHPDKIERFALLASEHFEVQLQRKLTLMTVRHYTKEIHEELTKNSTIILEQRTPETLQLLSL